VLQTLQKNFGLKIASLLLATLGWTYYRFADNPLIAARFDQQLSVPIAAINLPAGYVAHFPEKEAVVTVLPTRGQPPVKPDQIKAVIDFAKIALPATSGVYNVAVELISPNVVVQSLTPASVTLTIEKLGQKALPVSVHYSGRARVVVGGLAISPPVALVRGPAGELAQVTSVRLDVPLAGPARFDEMIRPTAINAQGHELPDLKVSPDLIRVRANFGRATQSGTPH